MRITIDSFNKKVDSYFHIPTSDEGWFAGQSIASVTLQVRQKLQETTLTRSKVIEAVKGICCVIDSKEPEFRHYALQVWEQIKVIPGNSIDRLPPEVIKNILKYVPDLRRAPEINLEFNAAVKQVRLEKANMALSNAFGAAEWKEFMGADVREEPPLPADILEILSGACPFSGDDRIVAETHLLMLIPETINGQLLNINTLGWIFKTKYPHIDLFGLSSIHTSTKTNDKSRWVLMTRDVIKGSKCKLFHYQQDLLAKRGKNKYEVPLALVVVACIFLEYARTKGQTRLYSDEPWTLTRCQEEVFDCQIVIGGFAKGELSAYFNIDLSQDQIGVAAMRKL